MTDYCDNIVKVFVPEHLSHLVPQLIAGLASPDAKEGADSVWMSFQRLLPRPALFDGEDVGDEIDAAAAARAGRLHHSVDWGDTPPDGAVAIMAELRTKSEAHARAMDLVTERFDRYGVPTAYEWQSTRWGTKWDAMEGDPPEVMQFDDMPGGHMLPDYEGSTVISWRFTTANSPPLGYIDALARLCVATGLGMRAWFSGSDGYRFNPATNDTETEWTELETHAVEIEETSAVRRLELSGGIDIEPDEAAERRIERRDPIFTLTE